MWKLFGLALLLPVIVDGLACYQCMSTQMKPDVACQTSPAQTNNYDCRVRMGSRSDSPGVYCIVAEGTTSDKREKIFLRSCTSEPVQDGCGKRVQHQNITLQDACVTSCNSDGCNTGQASGANEPMLIPLLPLLAAFALSFLLNNCD